MKHSIDLANGVEFVLVLSPNYYFKKDVIIKEKEQALKDAKKY